MTLLREAAEGTHIQVTSAPSPPTLAVQDLVKTFGDRRVVDRVSFALQPGEIFGFLGPNGSGKTTTIRMALDLIRPDSGSVQLFGGPTTRAMLRRVGYLPEERGLLQRARVVDVLRYLGRLKGLDSVTAEVRAAELMKEVGLQQHMEAKVQGLSRGMSQLVQFVGALLHSPDLIVLDEPFGGLDPLNVQLMKEMIRRQQERGATIIFSTHIMSDVEELCERVLLIAEGKTLVYGNLLDIKRAHGSSTVTVTADREPPDVADLATGQSTNGRFAYQVGNSTTPNDILAAFLRADIPVERFEVALPTLNEIFIEEVRRARHVG